MAAAPSGGYITETAAQPLTSEGILLAAGPLWAGCAKAAGQTRTTVGCGREKYEREEEMRLSSSGFLCSRTWTESWLTQDYRSPRYHFPSACKVPSCSTSGAEF